MAPRQRMATRSRQRGCRDGRLVRPLAFVRGRGFSPSSHVRRGQAGANIMHTAGAGAQALTDPPARPRRRVSIVIPAKNEAQNITWVLDRVPAHVDEVVLVDAHSTDGTIEAARSRRPDIVVVTDHGQGKGAAVRQGVEAASGDDIVMLDADGSMDPAEIDRFLCRLREGHDLVKGSRFL